MKKISVIICALALVAASCQKNEVLVNPNEKGSFSMEAIIENSSTKTQLVEGESSLGVEWSAGDSFSLFDGTNSFVFQRQGETSTFATADGTPSGTEFYAYYPAAGCISTSAEGFTVELPLIQEYAEGNIASGTFPMRGVYDGNKMKFKNLGAILSFGFIPESKDAGRVLKSAVLTTEQPLSGMWSLPLGSVEMTPGSNVKDSLILNCTGVTLAAGKEVKFHFAIPCGTYSGMKLTLESEDAAYTAEYEIEGNHTFTRSNLYSLSLESKAFDKEAYLTKIVEKQIADGCSPYVSVVVDVDYAPGQFTNTLPSGMGTKESAIASTAASIVGKTDTYVHLGGWGGSVTVGFDHPIINLKGADFRGYGNAFGGSAEPGVYYVAQKDAQGNPGKWYLIKHAMYDYSIHDYEITYYKPQSEEITLNKALFWDGTYVSKTTTFLKSKATVITSKDSDESVIWYFYNNGIYKFSANQGAAMIKGYKATTVLKQYASESEMPSSVTEGDKTYSLAYSWQEKSQVIDNYIYWEDNKGHNGYENKNSYHKQSYWPEYAGETIVIRGEYLPVNSFDQGGQGNNYVQDAMWWGFPTELTGEHAVHYDELKNINSNKSFGMGAWGYCDNYPNAHSLSTIDIEWAVDETGTPVHLDHIDFIKVQSGTHKQSGWIGEISTEFCGVEDLHIKQEKVTPYTGIIPDINNIPKSGDPLQPASGLLYWAYKQVERPSWIK